MRTGKLSKVHEPSLARSWLFAPGDSERKMAKALGSEADRIILDLEDAVALEAKPLARDLVRAFLEAHRDDAARLWVRINPLNGEEALRDLAAVMPGRPGGIMVPKVSGRTDIERLDRYLEALEVANGIAPGETPVLALVTETAQGMFHCGDYLGAPRLVGMTWGAEDLADALGASANTRPDGAYGFTYQMARSFCLLGAAAAGVTPIETICADFRDLDALASRAQAVRREGFRGMLAIHPAQVPVINAAFSPSADDIAEAREIVDLFAANPGKGTLAWRGGMVDRPWLARAQRTLQQAGL